jgi:uncharacterized protein
MRNSSRPAGGRLNTAPRRAPAAGFRFFALLLALSASAWMATPAAAQGGRPWPPPAGGPVVQGLPPVIHFCAANCMTLVLQYGRYVVVTRFNPDPRFSSIWDVERFTRDLVILHRHDLPGGWHPTYRGRISSEGNRLVNITVDGSPDANIRMTWGSALSATPGSNEERDRLAHAAAAGGAAPAAGPAPAARSAPAAGAAPAARPAVAAGSPAAPGPAGGGGPAVAGPFASYHLSVAAAELDSLPLPDAQCGPPLTAATMSKWDRAKKYVPAPDARIAAKVDEADLAFRARRYKAALEKYRQLWVADPSAARHAGEIFLFGLAVPESSTDEVNLPVARQLFGMAANKGDAIAMWYLGYLSGVGLGVKQDWAAAKSWFLKSAKLGYPDAEVALGAAAAYEHDKPTAADYDEAQRWFQLAASHDQRDAWALMGVLRQDGVGVAVDLAEALKLYRRAAAEGSGLGAQHLGLLYDSGTGVAKNAQTARCWFEKAALADDGASMVQVALLLHQEHREAEAVRWLLKAADRGNAVAMYDLGVYVREGFAGKKPPHEGYQPQNEWFARAEALGNPEAHKTLQALRDHNMAMLNLGLAIITSPFPGETKCYRISGGDRVEVSCDGSYDIKE